jgi:hypothetical protein
VDILPEKGDAVKVVGCFAEDKAWPEIGVDVTWRHPSLCDSCTVGGGRARNPVKSIMLQLAAACLSELETLASDYLFFFFLLIPAFCGRKLQRNLARGRYHIIKRKCKYLK